MKGVFITVEGSDGAGKTTHLDFIERWLSANGLEVLRTREPGGTALGEKLRDIVLNNDQIAISDRSELLLIFAARMQHLDEVIVPALASDKWVLCDRFTDATYAYQGGGRGIDTHYIDTLEQWVQDSLQPDLTLVLDVPVEVGLARTQHRGGKQDRFEKQAIEFKQAVRQVYLDRASQYSDRIRLIDSNQTIERVREEIKVILDNFGEKLK